ncbi:hypothetical protein [Kiloniella majae]|uniref:hypothetical protein n=1 Tax=Kiloniella majae TaxID=1938558 RepID=UPI000A277BEB|nr:hypothetical protein [Kiloniella majae]
MSKFNSVQRFCFLRSKKGGQSHPFCCEEAGSDKRDLDLVALTAPLSVIPHDAPTAMTEKLLR